MRTMVIRVPIEDGREIIKIQKKWKINTGAAYQIWKKKNRIGPPIKWEDI